MSFLSNIFGRTPDSPEPHEIEDYAPSKLLQFPDLISSMAPANPSESKKLCLFLSHFDTRMLSQNEDIGKIQNFLRSDGSALEVLINQPAVDVAQNNRFIHFVAQYPNTEIRTGQFIVDYSFALSERSYAYFEKGAGLGVTAWDIADKANAEQAAIENLRGIWQSVWKKASPAFSGPHFKCVLH